MDHLSTSALQSIRLSLFFCNLPNQALTKTKKWKRQRHRNRLSGTTFALQLAETKKKMTLCTLTIGCKCRLFRDSENKTRESQTLQSSHMSPPPSPPLSRPFDAHSPLFLGRSERDGPLVILDGACSCSRWRSCTSTNARWWISPSPRGSSRTLSSRGLRTRSLVETIGSRWRNHSMKNHKRNAAVATR